MAQLERPQRRADSPKTQETSKSPTIQTMEQLLRVGEASKSRHSPTFGTSTSSSSPSSPFFHRFSRHHDSEEDNGQNQKKSVLTKVKEKAKKLRHSLSKRRHDDSNASSPSSATALEGDGAEEDAEYLGPPVYESEKVTPGRKENVRQNLRASPLSPEKHVISSNEKTVMDQNREKSLSRSLSKKTTSSGLRIVDPPLRKTQSARENPTSTTSITISSGPNKPMTKTLAEKEKLTPVHEGSSESVKPLTSKIQGLTISKPMEHHPSSSSSTTNTGLSLPYTAPRTPPAKLPSQTCSTTPRNSSSPVVPSPSSAPAIGKSTSPTSQIWDKGVSVKEYLMNKLEPGEDERALSQVISEAMSPRRTPGDAGVMEKVREAVTSLLRNEDSAKNAETTSSPTATHVQSPQMSGSANVSRNSSEVSLASNVANVSRTSSEISVSTNAPNVSRTSSEIPVSTNAQEVEELEENHGRVLQAN